jgi:hypothetical protein
MQAIMTRMLLVYPLLALVGFAAVVVGLRQPPSAWSDTLRLNDCELPCWIGITPGQTEIADAKALVEQAFADASRYIVEKQDFTGRWATYLITHRNGGDQVGIYLETRDGTYTQAIGLILPATTTHIPTIPELSPSLGDVSGIRHLTNMGERFATRLWFRDGSVVIELQYRRCGRVDMNAPVREIYLVGDSSAFAQADSWQGFGRCYK